MKTLAVAALAALVTLTLLAAPLYGVPASRPPAVAGLFYPADREALAKTVRHLLDEASGAQAPGKIRALIAPHAGYVYSGVVAAAVYRQIDRGTKTVILLGPSHRIAFEGASIPDIAAYETPLGVVPLSSLASTLRKEPGIVSVPKAHDMEHALEVQLPFLQTVLTDFEIVPILTNQADPKRLAAILAPHVNEQTLVIASSDLSHYYSYDKAVSLDRVCTTAVIHGRFSDMDRCEACGKQAMLTLMHLAEQKGWQPTLVEYKNSGDTAGGRDRVVGYAAIAFVDNMKGAQAMKQDLSDDEKKSLVRLARSTIEARLVKGAQTLRPERPTATMLQERGCFVTLHKKGQLRGCIGTIEPVSPLIHCVEENAWNAAFRDPRFSPLSAEELADIDIEVSVLTVPEKIRFQDGEDLKRQLEPMVHGVILSQGPLRSTFLPQVWKQLPEKERFLENLCLKGRMPPQAWQDPKTEVKVYRAEVFGEKDLHP